MGMATAADVIRVAKAEIGTKESPWGSNHQKYGEWYGMDRAAWCAMFVSWVMHHAGVNLQISTGKGYAYCPAGVSWFQARGLWRSSRLSKPGDIVFFNFNGGSVAEHTGIVVANNPLSGSITTIEGNTGYTSAANGGEVLQMTRPRSVILGTGNMQHFFNATSSLVRQAKWTGDNGSYGHPLTVTGAKGEVVKHLQTLLLKKGINIVVDGTYGRFTLAAVKKFQSYHHLTADGQVGNYTWAALHS
jgi:hypothetical protein